MNSKELLENLIGKLIKDKRISEKQGNIYEYNQYSYVKSGKGYKEVLQNGFKISLLINEDVFIPNWITLYVWNEENTNKLYIKNSIKSTIFKFDIVEDRNVINKIVNMLLEKENTRKEFRKVEGL